MRVSARPAGFGLDWIGLDWDFHLPRFFVVVILHDGVWILGCVSNYGDERVLMTRSRKLEWWNWTWDWDWNCGLGDDLDLDLRLSQHSVVLQRPRALRIPRDGFLSLVVAQHRCQASWVLAI